MDRVVEWNGLQHRVTSTQVTSACRSNTVLFTWELISMQWEEAETGGINIEMQINRKKISDIERRSKVASGDLCFEIPKDTLCETKESSGIHCTVY